MQDRFVAVEAFVNPKARIFEDDTVSIMMIGSSSTTMA
jgi:hypothetical protein